MALCIFHNSGENVFFALILYMDSLYWSASPTEGGLLRCINTEIYICRINLKPLSSATKEREKGIKSSMC